MLPEIKKGQLLKVKAPPYYEKEYVYEVSGAGGKVIRANLHHSPKVKKSWTLEELEILFDMGIITLMDEKQQ
ncbi:MAG TPA: hypothetical protein EYN91_17575 [Candidatus Melainabacteria bacterium]|jgi:hypothetical protein|nr:hypothetical protein [Candidatus Melainabacteria bacterium]HIN63893.1 hypothetical protein [Candidatus Obscuribacterales bacterium]